jgi:hypothetical protein
MLGRIQQRLHELYDLDLPESVEDFVCGPEVASAAACDAVERGEVLVVVEQATDVCVGLYVDPAAVAVLGRTRSWWGNRRAFRAFCLATEGVSHFVYLMFRAARDQGVSQLELEIQAEVDKYATALLDGRARGGALARSRWLRRGLFHEVAFRDPPQSDAGQRYRLATRTASRFARMLESRYVARDDWSGMARELRRYYRLGPADKLQAG